MPLAKTFEDNISNVLALGDYGVKVARAGFDATTAADKDLLWNSSWPSIQIVKVVESDGNTPIAHGLGFPPVAFILGGSGYNVMVGQDVDNTNVYPDTTGTLVIYNIDISTDVEYPYTATDTTTGLYDPNYGIKVVKNGANISSTDMRDYKLHSRCGSPLVLAVKTQETVNPANPSIVQYTSQLGYETLNFGYIGRAAGDPAGSFGSGNVFGTNGYQFAPQGGQAPPIAFTDGFTIYTAIVGFADSRASVVCLRNPMFAVTNTEAVQYV